MIGERGVLQIGELLDWLVSEAHRLGIKRPRFDKPLLSQQPDTLLEIGRVLDESSCNERRCAVYWKLFQYAAYVDDVNPLERLRRLQA